MILKSLDIQGFKSFPDRTHIEFDRGVTAVVGPNGSGKSNLSDAIRWVLGEQSTRALRGAKMEDVVFSGTGKRKAMGCAEVSLTMDNSDGGLKSDFSEVMVTRRYFRSGESEFFINRKPTRLKDIHELFMDTGLGRDGYSMISQGKIDEILSVKSDERREVFNEAAGISKYRYRRDEAVNRLNDAQSNLTRIADIISELESRVGPLKLEAEKEKKYNKLKDELKIAEVSVMLHELDGMAERLVKARENCEAIARDEKAGHERTAELETALKKIAEESEDLNNLLAGAREGVKEAERQAAKTESGLAVMRARKEHGEADEERLKTELTGADRRKAELADQLVKREERLKLSVQGENEQRAKAKEAEQKRGELKKQADMELELLSGLEIKAEKHRELSAQAREQAGAASAQQDELRRQLQAMDGDDNERRSRAEEEKLRHAGHENAARECEEKVQEQKNVVGGFKIKSVSREKKEMQAREKSRELSLKLADTENRIKMLRELEREYEGFNKAVKIVMRENGKGVLRGIYGPVTSLMRVDDRFVVAAETALGAATQNIITENEEDARRAILLLKNRNAGRATFLPLTSVRGRKLNENGLEKQPGYLGVLSDIVQYDPKYSGVFESLLGRTAVAENIDRAISIAKRYNHRFRIVTLDGQVMNAGGSMTGGSVSRSAGILSRANELKRLNRDCNQLRIQAKSADKELEEASRENSAFKYRLDVAETELREAEAQLYRAKTELEQHGILTANLEASLNDRENRRTKLIERMEISEKAKNEACAHQKDAQDTLAKIISDTEQEKISRDEILNKITEYDSEIAECREKMTEYAAQSRADREAAAELRVSIANAASDKEEKEARLNDCRNDMEKLGKAITDGEAKLEELRKSSREVAGRLEAHDTARDELERRRTECDRALQDENRRLLDIERARMRAENEREMLGKEEERILGHMWESYELTRQTARELARPVEDRARENRNIETLKNDIRSLGTIYPGAIKEYQTVYERYEFMTSQRDDAEKSKKELEDMIADINRQMTELFSRQFAIINEKFSETFKEMFGGGSAKVELTDPKNVLESGVEIKVQPPGKALKVLTLLSGGERAFVAIALYFAILKVKPAPFCVLDEIESALDEVNVGRFAAYLRKMCGSTQFIVITHRRGTMEAADMLYGVAMPQRGVSRLLKLNVNEAEREYIEKQG